MCKGPMAEGSRLIFQEVRAAWEGAMLQGDVVEAVMC